MYYYSYLNSAKEIIQQYSGKEPLAAYLKKHFATDKKYGSRDRKQISHLCYSFFRLGKALPDCPLDEKVLIGLFLCSSQPNEIISALKPEWNEKIKLPLQEKLSSVNYQLSSLFPWKEELSDGINYKKFCESFFIQPDLFLRLRPGYEKIVKKKLVAAKIDFKEINASCLDLPNISKIDTVIELDKEAVVQDHNSQRTGEFLPLTVDHRPSTVWDCCAGSGGKSIMLQDLYPGIKLTVSDVRESILANLKKRFAKAGITKYISVALDLAKKNIQYSIPASRTGRFNTQFSIILCDIPCTGSGTWSRTPEQLFYFNEKRIAVYASLQKKIISNIISSLKPGGYLLYITCSVFKKENEEIVEFIKTESSLELIKMELLNGYDKKADSMFTALLKKPL